MVREHIDTIDSLMARYVAGTLPLPAHVLVESHLAMKGDAHGFVRNLESMAGCVLVDTPPVPLDRRDAMLAHIYDAPEPAAASGSDAEAQGASDMPAALRAFVGCDVADIPWRTKMPGFKEYDLGEVDGCHVSMFWIRPGRAVPAHTHDGCEISLVLQGAFNDGNGRYGPGDISVADDDVDHRPIAETDCPCIGFAVTDAPLKLTGSFRQLIGDLIG